MCRVNPGFAFWRSSYLPVIRLVVGSCDAQQAQKREREACKAVRALPGECQLADVRTTWEKGRAARHAVEALEGVHLELVKDCLPTILPQSPLLQ